MNDVAYVYGQDHGAEVEEPWQNSAGTVGGSLKRKHWDPRISVQALGYTVEVGIVPPVKYKDTNQNVPVNNVEFTGDGDIVEWSPENGKFIYLSRDGLNRLIRALREARDSAYGKDE